MLLYLFCLVCRLGAYMFIALCVLFAWVAYISFIPTLCKLMCYTHVYTGSFLTRIDLVAWAWLLAHGNTSTHSQIMFNAARSPSVIRGGV